MFLEERYLLKSKKVRKIIKLFNMPPFIPKKNLKRMTPVEFLTKKATMKIGGAQKKIDIASS